ncbi:stimulator of interferon genes protein [Protopterus annectens]|uniref:stimulator of interferon genes protein n=1 Tax=Protopterus annectens TaxID=7888 RepID=UPI001CF9DD1C|nr:stimulator of interferon genes protein [Protopterus annectens]
MVTHTADTIQNPRGQWAFVTICLITAALFLISYNYSERLDCDAAVYFFTTSVAVAIKGICDFVEECRHLRTRYHRNIIKALKECFGPSRKMSLLILAAVLGYIRLDKDNDPWVKVIPNCFFSTFCIAVGIHGCTPVEMSEICEKNKLNVAHGLAWSYYLGYLKLVLPELKKTIAAFNERHNNLLKHKAVWKLHILIPLSCEIYDKLHDADNNIMFQENTPELSIDRGGVQKRIYKHSVYQILDEDKRPHYCILEYATPLRTLFEMSNETSAQFSSEQRLSETKLFYRTLKEILDNSLECRDNVRLIIINDIEINNNHDNMENDPHFLSKEVLKHIKQQQEEEYSISEGNYRQMSSDDVLSREPQLMISETSDEPQPLRSNMS